MKIKNISPDKIKETYQQGKEALGNAYYAFKQKAEPKIRESIEYAQYAVNPPKVEVLSKKAVDAQKLYLQKSVVLKKLERKFPNQQNLIMERQRELMKLEQKAKTAVQKYNNFLANQNAAQKAFEELNN